MNWFLFMYLYEFYLDLEHNRHDITEILLKVALNTITLTPLDLELNYING